LTDDGYGDGDGDDDDDDDESCGNGFGIFDPGSNGGLDDSKLHEISFGAFSREHFAAATPCPIHVAETTSPRNVTSQTPMTTSAPTNSHSTNNTEAKHRPLTTTEAASSLPKAAGVGIAFQELHAVADADAASNVKPPTPSQVAPIHDCDGPDMDMDVDVDADALGNLVTDAGTVKEESYLRLRDNDKLDSTCVNFLLGLFAVCVHGWELIDSAYINSQFDFRAKYLARLQGKSLIIPIHGNDHWTCAVVRNPELVIADVYDSYQQLNLHSKIAPTYIKKVCAQLRTKLRAVRSPVSALSSLHLVAKTQLLLGLCTAGKRC
jgi:hypothetical protein